MGRLEGKVALISGGARGQGALEAMLFAQEGAKVVIGDILDEEGGKVETQILETGGEATYVHLDVTQNDQWENAVALAERKYGKLDILVNNAGITQSDLVESVSEADWDRILEINAKGVFLGAKQAIPAMKRAGSGSIVNTSSIAGIVGRFHSSPAYSASKGAVRVFTKATAVQYAADKIRSNSVHPGPIDTEMLRRLDAPITLEDRRAAVPLGRLGTATDVAYGVLYLASDEASFVTGSELVIDGGITAQ